MEDMAQEVETLPREQAGELVEECQARLMKFRSHCQNQIEMAEEKRAFWSREHDIVTTFLASDMFAPQPERMPSAKRKEPMAF
jgi:hypothetical protein